MKIRKLNIKSLFGTFDYELSFEHTNPFIITGPNGYGKTTILTIINSLSNKDLYYFYLLPFEEIRFEFDDDSRVVISSSEESIEQSSSDLKLDKYRTVVFEWFNDNSLISKIVLNRKNIEKSVRQLGYYRRFPIDTTNYHSDIFYSYIKGNKSFYDYFFDTEDSKQFVMLLDGVKSVFIEAQRIITIKKEERESPHYRIDEFSKQILLNSIDDVLAKLKKILGDVYLTYLQKSQISDGKFVDRLLASKDTFSEDEYKKRAEELQSRLSELMKFGLIHKNEMPTYNEDNARILTAYLDSVEDKIKVYDDILPKLRLFSNLISSKKFVNKSISFSPDRGFVVNSNEGLFLDVKKLSSGEQNEIIMLFYFIFEVNDNTIILLDEPEISLHVAWQNEFIENLIQIIKGKNIQVIVSTHSPQIIGNRWEQCFDLCEQEMQ